ncbi:hypothetical protein CK203_017272 [Vitis vinifera]|uniref:DUF4283 domain-containing protein n=1 Tax=Vitis vinifera TaxID=29760 RepID=A0A438JZB0_VITVI|nr:hypothetical protein CK203_017272 [Vitis vinifera]
MGAFGRVAKSSRLGSSLEMQAYVAWKGLLGGWNTLVEKLGDLGVALFVGAKPPITLVAQMKEERVVFGSFSEDAKSESKRLGDSVWLEVGGLLLSEFESLWEAERVLALGRKRVKENFLCLEKWNPEKDWRCCRGFITEDEDTTGMSELQWARILAKLDGRSLPSSTQVAVGQGVFLFFCVGISAMWKVKGKIGTGGGTVWVQDVSPPGDFLKDGAAFVAACSTRTHAVGYAKPSKEGRAGVEGNGMGGLGCLESQSLVGLDSLKTGDRKKGKKMGDGLLNGALRGPVEMLTSEEAFRAAATDEASCLKLQTLKTSGSFGLGRVEDVDREESMVPMKVMMPMGLLVIRCDSLDWTTGERGWKFLSLMEVGKSNERLVETKMQYLSFGVVHSLGVGRFLEWDAVNARGATGGMVVF